MATTGLQSTCLGRTTRRFYKATADSLLPHFSVIRLRDMYTFLLTLLILDAVVLAVAVLLQSGKGGGLAASFGGASSSADSVIGSRQAGNLLTKASWWCGGIFLGLAFVLQIMSSRSAAPKSVLDKLAAPASAPAAPSTGSGAAAPAAPLTQQAAPAAPAAAPAAPAKK